MLKKVLHILLIVSLLAGFTGCSQVSNEGKNYCQSDSTEGS